jgi:hypothetical protein
VSKVGGVDQVLANIAAIIFRVNIFTGMRKVAMTGDQEERA